MIVGTHKSYDMSDGYTFMPNNNNNPTDYYFIVRTTVAIGKCMKQLVGLKLCEYFK